MSPGRRKVIAAILSTCTSGHTNKVVQGHTEQLNHHHQPVWYTSLFPDDVNSLHSKAEKVLVTHDNPLNLNTYLLPADLVWSLYCHAPVEAPGTQQRLVQHVRPVGGRYADDNIVLRKQMEGAVKARDVYFSCDVVGCARRLTICTKCSSPFCAVQRTTATPGCCPPCPRVPQDGTAHCGLGNFQETSGAPDFLTVTMAFQSVSSDSRTCLSQSPRQSAQSRV